MNMEGIIFMAMEFHLSLLNQDSTKILQFDVGARWEAGMIDLLELILSFNILEW